MAHLSRRYQSLATSKRSRESVVLTFEAPLVGAAIILVLRITTSGEVCDAELVVVAGLAGQAHVALLAACEGPVDGVSARNDGVVGLLARGRVAGAVADEDVAAHRVCPD